MLYRLRLRRPAPSSPRLPRPPPRRPLPLLTSTRTRAARGHPARPRGPGRSTSAQGGRPRPVVRRGSAAVTPHAPGEGERRRIPSELGWVTNRPTSRTSTSGGSGGGVIIFACLIDLRLLSISDSPRRCCWPPYWHHCWL